MASDLDERALYFIQSKATENPRSPAGSLWQLNTNDLDQPYDTVGKNQCLAMLPCSLEVIQKLFEVIQKPQTPVLFAKDYLRNCFTKINPQEFDLLLAIKTERSRLDYFQDKRGILTWATTLTAGSRVGVLVKGDTNEHELLTGIIRHTGHYHKSTAGWHFGIELDPEHEGKGTSDGEFRKYKYFECKDNCAVFVNVDKLEQPQSADSAYVSRSSLPSDRLLTPQSVDDMVETCALRVGDRVVWVSDSGPELGAVRWIGVLPDALPPRDANHLTVGVEFDRPIGTGTGRYRSHTLFTAKRRHASLVPIMGLMKEADFHAEMLPHNRAFPPTAPNISQDTSHVRRLPGMVKQDGQPSERPAPDGLQVVDTDQMSVDRKGQVLPPSIADPDLLCGRNRGIQSYSDKCTLEAIIFGLFAFYSDFDKQLFASPAPNLTGEIKSVLVEQIINPLRATYFVSRDKMAKFGDLFTIIQSAKLAGCVTSNLTLLDDPYGIITTVLSDLLQVVPLVELTNGQSYVYELEVQRTAYPYPSLQHLVERSVASNPDIRLRQRPKSVFIVHADASRFAKLVTTRRIFPGKVLDVSGILQTPVSGTVCKVCNQQGTRSCGSCLMAESDRDVTDAKRLSQYTFCANCFDRYHMRAGRQDHKPYILESESGQCRGQVRDNVLLDLFAIVAVINGCYVTFLKVGSGEATAWLMYDGKAAVARSERTESQVYLPEVKLCDEIEKWLTDVPAAQRADSLPDIIVRITSGLRLCFFRPKHSTGSN